MEAKRAFLYGRRNGRSTMVMLVHPTVAPIGGPFTLAAVVSPN